MDSMKRWASCRSDTAEVSVSSTIRRLGTTPAILSASMMKRGSVGSFESAPRR